MLINRDYYSGRGDASTLTNFCESVGRWLSKGAWGGSIYLGNSVVRWTQAELVAAEAWWCSTPGSRKGREDGGVAA
jgi:hypothetical protein